MGVSFVFVEPAGLFETISCVLRTALGLLIFLSVATTTFNPFGVRHKRTAVPLYSRDSKGYGGIAAGGAHRLHNPRLVCGCTAVVEQRSTGRRQPIRRAAFGPIPDPQKRTQSRFHAGLDMGPGGGHVQELRASTSRGSLPVPSQTAFNGQVQQSFGFRCLFR